jgi:RNA polymerase sigma-70 factor (ECF subfamily)
MSPQLKDEVDAPPAEPADTVLVARAREGDRPAFEELMRRHQAKIYGLVFNMTGHREDTEDLVQTSFVKAYRSLPRFHGRSAFSTWLYRIALNTTINFLNRRRRRETASLDDEDQGVERNPEYLRLVSRDSPVRDASISELRQKLNAALERLSEKHRTVVVLHDVQGLPHEEIAGIMKCSQGTVRSRLFYARQYLQGELSEFAP